MTLDIEAIERRAATLHLGEVTNGDGVPDPDSGFITWTDAQGVDMGWVELSGQGAAVLAEQIVSRFAAHKDLEAEVATLRAALTAAEGGRVIKYATMLKACEDSDMALCESIGFDELPSAIRAAILRQRHVDAIATLRPAATQAKEIADDHAG